MIVYETSARRAPTLDLTYKIRGLCAMLAVITYEMRELCGLTMDLAYETIGLRAMCAVITYETVRPLAIARPSLTR